MVSLKLLQKTQTKSEEEMPVKCHLCYSNITFRTVQLLLAVYVSKVSKSEGRERKKKVVSSWAHKVRCHWVEVQCVCVCVCVFGGWWVAAVGVVRDSKINGAAPDVEAVKWSPSVAFLPTPAPSSRQQRNGVVFLSLYVHMRVWGVR